MGKGRYIRNRTAAWEDLPAILELRFERSRWLAGRGSPMLQDHATGIRQICRFLEDGEMRVVTDQLRHPATGMAAAYALTARHELYWDGDEPEQALYLHKVMTGTGYSGLGEYLVRTCENEARRQGKKHLRLNCHAGAEAAGLHKYWEKRGFAHVRTVHLPGRTTGALFQLETGA